MGVLSEEALKEGRAKPVNYQDGDKFRIDFWLKGKSASEPSEVIRVKHSVWVQFSESDPAKSGKIEVINGSGKTTWVSESDFAEKKPQIDKNGKEWFLPPYRRTYAGESNLHAFLRPWLNADKDTPTHKIDWKKLCNGNLPELHGFLKSKDSGYFKVLLGIQFDGEKKYQAVFPNYIMPYWMYKFDGLKKSVTDLMNNPNRTKQFDWGFIYGDTNANVPMVGLYNESNATAIIASVSVPVANEPLDLPVTSMHDDLPF
ncbi:MAG: hypothetical protein ACRCVT_10175 [Leadbetterella sp.]